MSYHRPTVVPSQPVALMFLFLLLSLGPCTASVQTCNIKLVTGPETISNGGQCKLQFAIQGAGSTIAAVGLSYGTSTRTHCSELDDPTNDADPCTYWVEAVSGTNAASVVQLGAPSTTQQSHCPTNGTLAVPPTSEVVQVEISLPETFYSLTTLKKLSVFLLCTDDYFATPLASCETSSALYEVLDSCPDPDIEFLIPADATITEKSLYSSTDVVVELVLANGAFSLSKFQDGSWLTYDSVNVLNSISLSGHVNKTLLQLSVDRSSVPAACTCMVGSFGSGNLCDMPDISEPKSHVLILKSDIVAPLKSTDYRLPFSLTPSPGAASVEVSSSVVGYREISSGAVSVTVALCLESFSSDNTNQIPWSVLKVSALPRTLILLSALGLRGELSRENRVATFSFPRLPYFFTNETIDFALSDSPSFYTAGLVPSQLVVPASLRIQVDCNAESNYCAHSCQAGYVRSLIGKCEPCPACAFGVCVAGPACECEAGFQGPLCAEMTTQALAGAVAGAGVFASVALEVAVGGSLVSPINTLTVLQQLYVLGQMPCSKEVAQEVVSGLRAVVSPFSIRVTGKRWSDYLFGVWLLHVLLLVLVCIPLAVVWLRTPVVFRHLRTVAGKVFFPNSALLVVVVMLLPSTYLLVASATERITWVVVLCGLYFSGMNIGYFAFLWWFWKKRLNPPNTFVEYLKINLGNSASNATCAIGSDRRRAVMPSLLVAFLPTGYWCARHLKDRSFLKKYGLLLHDLSPSAVGWFPFFYAGRLVIVALVAARSDDACVARLMAILVANAAFLVALAREMPYKCFGSNLVAIVSQVLLCGTIVCFYVAKDLVSPFLIAMTVVIIFSAVWTAVVFFTTRRRYDPLLRDQLSQKDHNDDIMEIPKAVGFVTVGQGCSTDNVDGILQKNKASGKQYWCELRGSVLLLYANSESSVPVDILSLEGRKAVPLEDSGVALSGTDGLVSVVPTENKTAWTEQLLRSVPGASMVRGSGGLEQVPKVDRTRDVDFFGTPIVTTHGEYRFCTTRGGNTTMLLHVVRKKLFTASQRRTISSEVIILSRLQSDFVVSVKNPFESDEYICWFAQYHLGGNLYYHLDKSGAFGERDAAFFIGEAILGLEHLHANRIIFRNLSPSDILFSEDGHVVLADPGMPVSLTDESKVGYVSPQVLRFQTCTIASDYWSLGCIMYLMLHNQHAFNGKSRAVTARLVLHSQPRVSSTLSPAAHRVLETLMHKTNRNFDGAHVKSHAWFAEQGLQWNSLEDRSSSTPFLTEPPLPPLQPCNEVPINPLHFTFNRYEQTPSAPAGAASAASASLQSGTPFAPKPRRDSSEPMTDLK